MRHLRTPKIYKEITEVFLRYMIKELKANHDKGGRENWLKMSNKTGLNELYYHVGKLQAAVATKNIDLIKEHTADIANAAMMVLDINIKLLPDEQTEIL